MKTNSAPIEAAEASGFALVVSLTLMAFLLMLVLALLSLSSVSLREQQVSASTKAAQANARLAMMVAIGELQRTAGPDTRVTARADILDESNPPLLGVWKSWEGTNHELSGNFAGRPVQPDYDSKEPGDPDGRFITWLTSWNLENGPSTLPGDTRPGNGRAALVGPGSVGSTPERESLQIHLEPSLVESSIRVGTYAWWVSGENQKARLRQPETVPDDAASWAGNLKSHSTADPGEFRMDSVFDEDPPDLRKVISLKQSDFVADAGGSPLKASQEFFHDLSTSATGLLTNTATGGWRKDMSLMTENWDDLPTSGLPFFRVRPGEDLAYSRASPGDLQPDRSLLYPWGDYFRDETEAPIYQPGPVSSWTNLQDYTTLYKRISGSSASSPGSIPYSSNLIWSQSPSAKFDYVHQVRLMPFLARVEWIFSHYAAEITPGVYEPRLLLTPVFTLWNPYNVVISPPSDIDFAHLNKPLPVSLQYTINDSGSNTTDRRYLSGRSANYDESLAMESGRLPQYKIALEPFQPGETRIFSPAPNDIQLNNENFRTVLELKPGVRIDSGFYFRIKDDSQNPLRVDGDARMTCDPLLDVQLTDGGQSGIGVYLDMNVLGEHHFVYRMVYPSGGSPYAPLENELGEVSMSEATSPKPFMSAVFGTRSASHTRSSDGSIQIPAKGLLQTSPLVSHTAKGGLGTNHPVNYPFDYSFVPHPPFSDQLPNADDQNRGYIVTGSTAATGLTRCVIAELPVRPLASLAELQHWDLRQNNPMPPFAFNIIGNSDATPLIASDSVVMSGEASNPKSRQYDDFYSANHLLFDDWFFSSIAPDPVNFGSSIERDTQQVFTDFVSGEQPLPNRAYRPIAEDAANPYPDELYDEQIDHADSWKTVASRIEVEGMFNVNSTSVKAWRALLGHARNQRIPNMTDAGAIDLSGEQDYAHSRFTVAGDGEATSDSGGFSYEHIREFTGYRVLDDATLDEFATLIVDEVRARGPFLSLAEFVNRRLDGSDDQRALAGAIQAALNKLAESSNNPYAVLQGESLDTSAPMPEYEYAFPTAAEGKSAYGFPGWTRQADVLRPLAPILSVRDDTFAIRAYGDSRDTAGRITATAVCEAVVKRTRSFVNPADVADRDPASEINLNFGRRFEIVSFRWLSPDEI